MKKYRVVKVDSLDYNEPYFKIEKYSFPFFWEYVTSSADRQKMELVLTKLRSGQPLQTKQVLQ